ncbi:MAG: hypothetical protein AAGA37_01935 [Actinomycetota bacterium]
MATDSNPEEDQPSEHVARWLLLRQECRLSTSGVEVRQSTRWGRRSFHGTIPYQEISPGRRSVVERASSGWLIAGALFASGVVFNLLARNDGWVANAAFGAMITTILSLVWVAKRTKWVGYPPLMVINRGDRSEDFLTIVMQARAEHIVTRVAEHDLTAAFRLIEEWRHATLISDSEAQQLWAHAQSRTHNPGGYL